MKLSARADYAVRAAVELAVAEPGTHVKAEAIAKAQRIPVRFLEGILLQLRKAGIVASQRGAEGGYWLARDPATVNLAEVIRAVDGPLASVRGERPEGVSYAGAAEALARVWIAVRASLREVLEHVTLADVAQGRLPARVEALAADPDAWITR